MRRSWLFVPGADEAAHRAAARSGEELAYVRARFLVECRAAGVEAIDCPYTFSDVKGAVADARTAKKLGYRMKSLVDPSHARGISADLRRGKTPARVGGIVVTQ